MKPVRIQLSRRKGFRLQEHSRAINGLDAVKVDRTTQFGNLSACMRPHGCAMTPCGCCPRSTYCCVEKFREFVVSGIEKRSSVGGTLNVKIDASNGYPYRTRLVEGLPKLRGKNLACWCGPGPCHADVLLELANGQDGGGAG